MKFECDCKGDDSDSDNVHQSCCVSLIMAIVFPGVASGRRYVSLRDFMKGRRGRPAKPKVENQEL